MDFYLNRKNYFTIAKFYNSLKVINFITLQAINY